MSASDYDRAIERARDNGTPLLVFSPERLRSAVDDFTGFVSQLPMPTEAFYSYKTNYLPELCSQVAACGIGAEVTSLVEYGLARRFCPPDRIVVNGIGKMAGLLQACVEDNPRLVNLETDTEIEHLRGVAGRGDTPLRVGLRVVPDGVSGEQGSDPSLHWRRGTAKFGWTSAGDGIIHAARAVAANPALALETLHLHAGSQVVSARFYDRLLGRICALLGRLRSAGIGTISTLDLGGGLASGWTRKRRIGPLFETLHAAGLRVPAREQQTPDLDGIAAVIRRHAPELRGLGIRRLIVEPGRFLAEPTLVAVATVIAIRRDGRRRHAVLDIGTNGLHCWRSDETRPVVFDHPSSSDTTTWTLAGPLCHRGDSFGTVTGPADLQPGMLACLDAVGSYSIGDWIANTWLRPPVVDIDGRVLWRRQTAKDFFAPAETVEVCVDAG